MGNFSAKQDTDEQQKESVFAGQHREQQQSGAAESASSTCDVNANNVEQYVQVNEAPYKDPIVIYTDGAFDRRRRGSAVGCFFGVGHPLNFGKRLYIPDDVSQHDNNVAEIMAAQMALEKLLTWPHSDNSNRSVVIRSDSQSLVKSMNREPFPHHFRFARRLGRLKELTQQFPLGVTFEHVPGHANVDGNKEADHLARNALRHVPEPRSRSWNGRSRSRSRGGPWSPRRSRSDFVHVEDGSDIQH